MAYKLLVADDEYWAREKLRCILDWGRYDIEFLEPACDGEEALAKIQTESPHIFITDINMPGLSGVELLEKLARQHSEMVILVVSGYDTFDFVKRSMRSGAINYLLKPVSKLDLISAVSEALQILHSRQEQSQEQLRQQTQLLRASSLLQDREMSILLDKQNEDQFQSLSMNVPLNVAGYRLLLLKVHDMTHAMELFRQDINGLSYTVKHKLHALPGKENLLIFNHFSRSNEFILLADKPEHSSMEAVKQYCNCMEQMFHSPITVVFGPQSYPMNQIRLGYLQAVSMMNRRRFYPVSQVISPEMPEAAEEPELQWTAEMERHLSVYLQNGNRKQLEQLILEDTGLQEVGRKHVSLGSVVKLVSRMNHALQCSRPFSAASMDDMAVSNLAEEALHSLDTLDYGQFQSLELALIDCLMDSRQEAGDNSMHAVVCRVCQDIDEHYYEPFTLALLSKKYLVESSYLSRCFKQETGENLMMYLAERRIQKAVEAIHENKTGLTEISFLVGYDDYTYFSRVFKKIMGISPREYKNQYLAEQRGGKP